MTAGNASETADNGAEATVRIEDGVPWIGDRSFRWASLVKSDDSSPSFKRRQFQLTFENGWRLSIIWGSNAYCSNRDAWDNEALFREACPEAEIGAWLGDSELLPWDSGDTVKGWVPAGEVARLIDQMMTWPSDLPDGGVLTLNGIRVGDDA